MSCIKIHKITGPWTEDLENHQNISLILFNEAPISGKKEAVLTFTKDGVHRHRVTKIASYHRLMFDQDWDQLIRFFKYVVDGHPDDMELYGTRFVIQQRTHQPGCFQIYCDHKTTFYNQRLQNGGEIWVEMDKNPLNNNEDVAGYLADGTLGQKSDYWVYLNSTTIRKIIDLNDEVNEFFKNGLDKTCTCTWNDSFDDLKRCQNDPDIDLECNCERCVDP